MNKKTPIEALDRLTEAEFKKADKTPITLVLDNVRSAQNVGSIFRTADSFLIEKIILCGITPTPPSREMNKTALGSTQSVSWSYNKSTPSSGFSTPSSTPTDISAWEAGSPKRKSQRKERRR